MRKALIVLLALAGCAPGGGNASRAEQGTGPDSPPHATVQTRTLTGLYEAAATRPSQLCIVEQGARARFGLVTWQGDRPACSGAGTAVRRGDALRLNMNGESGCTIEARIADGRVTFLADPPRGCSYYCAPGAPLAGLAFTKTGGTSADALRARDLVGDPLCG
ncbi:MAG TPA: hypothetical protein VMS43_14665 [Allosphingosinicella sp.]|nr:hypothetical protein [Allosphingosinicella sp.]